MRSCKTALPVASQIRGERSKLEIQLRAIRRRMLMKVPREPHADVERCLTLPVLERAFHESHTRRLVGAVDVEIPTSLCTHRPRRT
jgi:hypothetical protein